jgi:hypothetical protein
MLSFIVLAVSSGVLYFIPDRGVTAWTNWSFLFLDKQMWDNLHINLGLLFLVMIIWHIYYNWKPIKNYLKIKKELKIFTKEFNIALIIVTLFTVGTITMTLPFSFFINIGNGIKAKNSLYIANPPYSYAEFSTFDDFCKIASIDINRSLEVLKDHSFKIDSTKKTLKEISLENHTTPKKIYNLIRNFHTKFNLPTNIPIGIAHKSLKQLSKEYKIDTQKIISHLKKYNIKADINTPFKKISKQNGLHPAQLYSFIIASQID